MCDFPADKVIVIIAGMQLYGVSRAAQRQLIGLPLRPLLL